MSNFGPKEKAIATLLSKNPAIKNFVKQIYQRCNYFLNKKEYQFKSDYQINVVDNSSMESFFGYYDKSPENEDGSKVIYYRTNYSTRNKPSKDDPIEIVLKCLDTGLIEVIDKTYTYNWQQGAKMMWLSNNKFIYNVLSESTARYNSKIYDIINKTYQNIDYPIYDCYRNHYGLTLNYSRLRDLRPDYGYRNISDFPDYLDYSKDGVFKISFDGNSSNLIISLRELIDLKFLESMKNARHKVNHIMVGPDGKNFMFMHRWHDKSIGKFDRLLVYNFENKELKIISDEGGISHCCWKDNKSIIGYLKHDNKFDFYEIDINSGKIKKVSNKLETFGDGHPTFAKNKLLFDSYPDRSRMKKIYIYDFDKNKINFLAELYESFKFYNETRCDLHPRFNKLATVIYFDSVHEGLRKLYSLNLNKFS